MTSNKVVQAIAINGFETLKRTRDSLNAQQKRLERPERYRIKCGAGIMRLEAYTPRSSVRVARTCPHCHTAI